MTLKNKPASPLHLFARELAPLSTAIVLTTAMVAFESLSVSAALPEIGADLGSVDRLPWTVTAYLLASGLALALAGSVIDRLGTRIVFRVATLTFVLASGLCAAAPSLGLLIGGRVIQGLAGGALFATTGAAIGLKVPAAIRSRAYALAATVWGVLAVSGPALAAVLLAWLGWRSIFWVNVPLGLVAAAIGWRPMPDHPGPRVAFRLDVPGALLVASFTTAGLLALSGTTGARWLWLAGALLVAALFWRHSGRVDEPILARRYFAENPFRSLALTAGLAMAAGMGVETFLPLYLRGAREASLSLATWSVLFLAFGWTVSANIAGRLYHRVTEARVAQVSTLLAAVPLALAGIAIVFRAPVGVLFVLYFAVGMGIGATSNACLTLVQASADDHEIGRATAAHQFLRTVAITFGTAAAGATTLVFATGRSSGGLAPLDPEALNTGFASAHALAVALAIGAAVAAGRLPDEPSVKIENQDPRVDRAVPDADLA